MNLTPILDTVTPEETDAIRIHLQRQHLYGPDRFRRAIEAQSGRAVCPRKIGRPRKSLVADEATR
jgi:putative transposase